MSINEDHVAKGCRLRQQMKDYFVTYFVNNLSVMRLLCSQGSIDIFLKISLVREAFIFIYQHDQGIQT